MNGKTRKEGILTCSEKLLAILGIALLSTGIWMLSAGGTVKAPSVGIEYVNADQSIQSGSIGITSWNDDIAADQEPEAIQAPEKCKVAISPEKPMPCPAPQKDIWRAVKIEDGNVISGKPVKRTPVVEDLNPKLKSAAQEIYRQIETSTEDFVKLSYLNLTDAEMMLIQEAVTNSYAPYYQHTKCLFCMNEKKTVHFVDMSRWKEALAEQKAIAEFVDQVKSKNSFTGMTEKYAYIRVHDIVNDFLRYDYSGQSDSLIEVIRGKTGLCCDYSRLVQAICESIGISCRTCIGTADGVSGWGGHEWNQIKIGDRWYYSDACWDDTTKNDWYLLSAGLWSNHTMDEDTETAQRESSLPNICSSTEKQNG